ncbi:MAG: two-component regulator propeller domain-containing protein, partial [Flavobacteriales bacterium]|nr:two-component regulator propeller domain-containing protein [Flavobacteriales bacterium]
MRLFLFILILLPAACSNQSDTSHILPAKGKSVEGISSSIRHIHFDKEGTGWFGTNSGLYTFHNNGFEKVDLEAGSQNAPIFDVIQDNAGNFWIGSQDGLFFKERTNQDFVQVEIPFSDTTGLWLDKVYPIINPNAVHSLHQDREGLIWVGTCGAGIYQFDPMKPQLKNSYTFRQFLHDGGALQEDGLHHNWISDITEDSQGNIWVSSMTRGGATKYDGSSFRTYMPEDGLSTDMVRTVYEDHDGTLWFGFKGNPGDGITKLENGEFQTFRKEDGLCNIQTRTFFQDRKDRLWIAGDLGNVCIFEDGVFREFTFNGNPIPGVVIITEDAEGSI